MNDKNMEEKTLITKIESLKNIKPREDWVSFTREEIFEEGKILFPFFLREKVFIGTFALLLVGVFALSQTFTGNSFYNKIASYFSFENKDIASEEQKEIELLSLTLNELREARTQFQKDFASSIVSKPENEVVKIAKDYAPTILEIREKEKEVSETLGVKIDKDSDLAEKEIASLIIQDLEKRSLITEEKEMLNTAKDHFEKGEYLSSLRIALEIGNNNLTEEETIKTEVVAE